MNLDCWPLRLRRAWGRFRQLYMIIHVWPQIRPGSRVIFSRPNQSITPKLSSVSLAKSVRVIIMLRWVLLFPSNIYAKYACNFTAIIIYYLPICCSFFIWTWSSQLATRSAMSYSFYDVCRPTDCMQWSDAIMIVQRIVCSPTLYIFRPDKLKSRLSNSLRSLAMKADPSGNRK